MNYLMILLISIFFLFLPFSFSVCAQGSSGTIPEATSYKEKANPVSYTLHPEIPEPGKTIRPDNADKFSDYPKSFIVPRGVCETNEPAMIINR